MLPPLAPSPNAGTVGHILTTGPIKLSVVVEGGREGKGAERERTSAYLLSASAGAQTAPMAHMQP